MAEKAKEIYSYVGREVRVFVNPASLERPSSPAKGTEENESDDFYELTPDDYARLAANKKEERFLKPKKLREAEMAARRARISKATVRIQFPDNIVLEADFKSTDSVVEILEILKKVLLKPELPFHLYTTPPKQVIKDYNIAMYDAGFAPGGIVYFSYDDGDVQGPFLKDDVLALQYVPWEPVRDTTVQAPAAPEATQVSNPRPAPVSAAKTRSTGKPKWLKLGK